MPHSSKADSILNAAADLFLAHGFKDVSITNIVSAAACSRETVYRYFKSKEDIFANIIAHLMDDYLSVMQHAIKGGQDNLRDGLIEWSLALLLVTTDEKYIRFRRLVISEISTRPEQGKLYFDMTYKRGTAAVAEYFTAFRESGVLKPVDPYRLATYFVGMILYEPLLVRLLGVEEQRPREALLAHITTTVDDFLDGFAIS